MGCCTSGNSSSSHRVLVSYAGKTQSFQNTTTLGALKIVVARSFPEVSGPFVLLSADGTAFTEDSYPRAYGQTTELKVQIKVLEPHKFADAAWVPLSEATFKIANKDGKTVGTGFLISRQLALTSSEVVKSTAVKDLKGHFDVTAPLDFVFDPQFIVTLNAGTTDSLILLKLTQALPEKPFVRLANEVTVSEGERVTVIHVSAYAVYCEDACAHCV